MFTTIANNLAIDLKIIKEKKQHIAKAKGK
jgi:hypothetical protein